VAKVAFNTPRSRSTSLLDCCIFRKVESAMSHIDIILIPALAWLVAGSIALFACLREIKLYRMLAIK
jgi:uncharacterized membrane protein